MKLYLAGPEVFFVDAISIGRAKCGACEKVGFEGLYPLDNEIDDQSPSPAAEIYLANVAMIGRADAIVANLTPFRGASADAGTAVEVGLAFALKKPVHGYSNVAAPYFDRVAGDTPRAALVAAPDGRRLGADGMAIEDFGLADNLMLIEAIRASGGVFLTPEDGRDRPIDDLTLFKACLAEIVRGQANDAGRGTAQSNEQETAGRAHG